MSLTRKYLKEIGIESEKIDLIIEAHTETTDSLKSERDSYREKAEAVDRLKTENEELKKTTGSDAELQAKYKALEDEFTAYKAEQVAQETLKTKQSAFTGLLKELKVSEQAYAKALKLADFDTMEVKDGKLKDVDKVKEYIKAEWADFIVSTETEGAEVDTPPTGDGSDSKPSIPLIF